mmetsp:Transcript_10636/g.13212  ORF Transcript_10636/g.13212 Transcript_10636/m.13212 type:complete len:94 (-) Transcript_10636:446-727(-)
MVETERRLPEYFPLAPKACAVPAASFFDCFSAKGKQADDVADADAGKNALLDCAQTLAAYEKCMNRWQRRQKEQPTLYRVPEEYRVANKKVPS